MFFTSVRPNDFERKKLESTQFKSKRDQTFFQLYFFAFLWEVRITNIKFVKYSFFHALTNILHTSYFPVPEAVWSGVSPLFFMKILVTWFASRTLQISRCPQNALQTYIRFFICMSSFIFCHNILSCKMFLSQYKYSNGFLLFWILSCIFIFWFSSNILPQYEHA